MLLERLCPALMFLALSCYPSGAMEGSVNHNTPDKSSEYQSAFLFAALPALAPSLPPLILCLLGLYLCAALQFQVITFDEGRRIEVFLLLKILYLLA